MSSKRVTLSLTKLLNLLNDRQYTPIAFYCEENMIKFVETRTPKTQKTFMISIPSKYKMTCDSTAYKSIEIHDVSEKNRGDDNRQVEYLLELKGPLLDCDLLSISSSMLCLCKNNGGVEMFGLGVPEKEESEHESEEHDQVSKLIKDSDILAKKMGEDDDDGEDAEGGRVENNDEDDVEEILEKEDATKVKEEEGRAEGGEEKEGGDEEGDEPVEIQLEFEDGDGNPVDGKVNSLMETEIELPEESAVIEKAIDASVEDLKKSSKNPSKSSKNDKERIPEEVAKPKSRKPVFDNSVPPNLSETDISLGIVYYCMEIGSFYKNLTKENLSPVPAPTIGAKIGSALNLILPKTTEDTILDVYDTLDDNECEMRTVKLDEIVELSAKLALKAKGDVEIYRKEELDLKGQILKLSSVLDKSKSMLAKMNATPEKYASVKPEILRLDKQTRTTLYEINIAILRNKDRIDELLEQYQSSLEDLLGE